MASTTLKLKIEIVEFLHNAEQICLTCGTHIAQGKHLLVFTFIKGEAEYKYILGTKKFSCHKCNGSSTNTAMKFFNSTERARAEKRNLLELIIRKGTTRGIPLIAWSTPY